MLSWMVALENKKCCKFEDLKKTKAAETISVHNIEASFTLVDFLFYFGIYLILF